MDPYKTSLSCRVICFYFEWKIRKVACEFLKFVKNQDKDRMSWFSELAGKAENLLNNIDERTASALQNRNKETTVMYADTEGWGPQTRRPTNKKPPSDTRSLFHSPPRKLSPPPRQLPKLERKEPPKQMMRRPPNRKGYEVQNYKMMPEDRRKMVGDEILVTQEYGSYRRKSLPNSKEIEDVINRSQKADVLAVENQMLKNEVAVCNNEIAGLIDKLKIVEDDLRDTDTRYEILEKDLTKSKQEKDSIAAELTKTKEKSPAELESGPEYSNLLSAYRALEHDFANVTDRNREYQTQIKELELSKTSNSSIQMKLENDLRFAHMTMNDLRADLEKARVECHRIQSDWDAYKVRVKSMLLSKDKEILALQQDPDFSEGTKMLAEQVESLRDEREQLSCSLREAQDECADASRRIEQVEQRAHSSDRCVAALREALREERQGRNKTENQCIINNQALKRLQMETTLQIAALQTVVHEKDNQIQKYKSTQQHSVTSVCPDADRSALNVAECEKAHEVVSNERIRLLTQALASKQGRIDVLVAENNTLKLQMEHIEAKHRQQLSGLQSNRGVVTVSDGDAYLKARLGNADHSAKSTFSRVSFKVGPWIRRIPGFRWFMILYFVVFHLWVIAILLTYTPEAHGP